MGVIYGPVPSWRLGRSLGIDLLPGRGKTCSFDCVYCQLGRTTGLASERQVFVETDRLRSELDALPLTAADVDYLTFSGTGEPTLADNLGEAIARIRRWPALQGVPVAVLTNATLLSRPDVCQDLAAADLVVAKLDAPDEVQLNTPLRASPTPPLERAAMAEIEQAFSGLPAVSAYYAHPPRVRVMDQAETRRRRPAEGHPQAVVKEVS